MLIAENMSQILSKAGASRANADKYAPWIAEACTRAHIDTPKRMAAFLAQLMIESNYLRATSENLNYSARGLSKVSPKRYAHNGVPGQPNELALSIAGKPQMIANHFYANRMGNGSPESGDGWKHRGRGLIQVTGKNNYCAYFKYMGLPLDTNPDIVATPEHCVNSAIWYWEVNKLNVHADKSRDPLDAVSDVVNIGRLTARVGDAHGFQQRKKVYGDVLALLNINPRLLEKGRQLVLDSRQQDKVQSPDIDQALVNDGTLLPETEAILYADSDSAFTPL